MTILFRHDLVVASEHNGGESRVCDALKHSTLCLFRILIEEGFLVDSYDWRSRRYVVSVRHDRRHC